MYIHLDGTVGGTATQSGSFDVSVQVTDSTGATATSSGTFGVYPAFTVTAPCASQCSVEQGCLTVCGNFGSASGGLAPYQYVITNGAVPPGMGLSGLSLTGAFPSPGPIGGFQLSIQVTDQFGATGTVNASWYVFQHITFTSTSAVCQNGNAGSCTAQFTYSGGTPNAGPVPVVTSVNATIYKPNPTGGCGGTSSPTTKPPPGYTATANAGVMTFAAGPADFKTWCQYTGTVTFVLVDQSPCGPGYNCSTSATATVRVDIFVG